MGIIRFKRRGDGQLNFKRLQKIAWEDPVDFEGFDVVGTEGSIVRAVVAGNPRTIRQDEVVAGDTKFEEIGTLDYLLTPVKTCRVVSGNLFRDASSPFLSLGAWAPTLSPSMSLVLALNGLEEDAGYELRLVFPRTKTAQTCRFIAHATSAKIPISSTDPTCPPSLSAYVLRKFGDFPRVFARISSARKDADEALPEVPGEDLGNLVEE